MNASKPSGPRVAPARRRDGTRAAGLLSILLGVGLAGLAGWLTAERQSRRPLHLPRTAKLGDPPTASTGGSNDPDRR